MSNSFGNRLRLTTFGESHGPAIGGIIDGFPAGLTVDLNEVQRQLDRRRPGQSDLTTARNEADRLTILSGIMDSVTTGTPIGFTIANSDQRSGDYDELRDALRPSHADFTYAAKYGLRDHRGGGRSSARETAARVVGGAFARQLLDTFGVTITAYTSQIGPIGIDNPFDRQYSAADIEASPVRCPDRLLSEKMEQLLLDVKADGDTVGGVISCMITGVPCGWGDPVFDKLHASLAGAMMGINAAKGFEYGMGFSGAGHRGSEMLDELVPDDNGGITSRTNHSGGILGGISSGQPIYFRVAFKPVATLMRPVGTVSTDGRPITLKARGRHDPCVVPRAVPIVEAMAALVLADAALAGPARIS